MNIYSRASRIFFSLFTIVLLLLSVFNIAWYQPSGTTAPGEQTSKFLPDDTNLYVTFNLLPGAVQSTYFNNFLAVYKDAILTKMRNLSSLAADFIEDNDWASVVGPELSLATFDENTSSGLVFFVQIPTTQPYPDDVRDLVIYFMDQALGGKQSQTNVGGGIIRVNRSVGSELKFEYYVNTTVSSTTNRYVVGAIGNISLSDFQNLNTSVANGTWTGGDLSANASFKTVQGNLPSPRIGLAYMNKNNLQSNAVEISSAVQPYLTAMDGKLPGISTIKAGLDYLTSPIYDDLEPYVPAYAGASISGVSYGLRADFYSPDDSYPVVHGKTNSLATAVLIPSTALSYATDVNANAWWHALYPKIQALPADWDSLFDTLTSAGFNKIIDVNLPLVYDFARSTGIDANTFNWSSGAFAWSHLTYSSNQGQLLVFDVTNYPVALSKIGSITNALNTSGITGVEYRFVNGNTSLLLGWPAGVISNSQLGPRLQNYAYYLSMTSYLLSPIRGLVYKHAVAPLQDIGVAYYIGSAKGRIVLRMPTPTPTPTPTSTVTPTPTSTATPTPTSTATPTPTSTATPTPTSIATPTPTSIATSTPGPTATSTPTSPEQLFDIRVTLDRALLEKSADLTVRIRFESFGTVPTPVDLTFIVFDESGQEVYQAQDSIIVETEANYVKRFPNLNLSAGDYVMVVRTLYNVDVSDEFRQDFSVQEKGGSFPWYYIVIAIGAAGVLAAVSVYILRKNRQKKARLLGDVKRSEYEDIEP
jgi:hypothetical protein